MNSLFIRLFKFLIGNVQLIPLDGRMPYLDVQLNNVSFQ